MKVDGRTIELSNPDKVLFPDAAITKGELADYYRRIAGTMLPHIEGRPLTLHRFPDGIGAEGFYQQNVSDYFPDWIARATISQGGRKVEHCLANDAATLVYLAGQAVITPHAWLAHAKRPDCPTAWFSTWTRPMTTSLRCALRRAPSAPYWATSVWRAAS
jgi:bifunctional non-homologous end joining protein LigD